MSVKSLTTKGRPSNPFSNATGVLRYLPRPRTPWQPSSFKRGNMDPKELGDSYWGSGRFTDGYNHPDSGYHSGKGITVQQGEAINDFIPTHELEKFMPNINLGPKALVTPVSVMNARAGHRVSHDLLHSYDKYIGKAEEGKDPVVDHDNISAKDPNFVGLNADVIGCRWRIYRWMRRGPFFNEDHYFRRTATDALGRRVESVAEAPLYKRIVSLATKGKLKSACELYRQVTHIPPVEVYRALTQACIAGGKLADAVAIYEEGSHRLLYTARDFQVLKNVLLTAINADNVSRVMWTLNHAVGTYHENVIARVPLESHQLHTLFMHALSYLLDARATTEARIVYEMLKSRDLLDYDLHAVVGMQLREAIKAKKKLVIGAQVLQQSESQRSAVAMAPEVAKDILRTLGSTDKRLAVTDAMAAIKDQKDVAAYLGAWLQEHYRGIDVPFVLRASRYEGARDLMKAELQDRYVSRASLWLSQLSTVREARDGKPLAYLKRSKPSAVSSKLRIAADSEMQARRRLLPSQDGFVFHYDAESRFVTESFPVAGATIHSKFLAQQPTHQEVRGTIPTDGVRLAKEQRVLVDGPESRATVLHPSVTERNRTMPSSQRSAELPVPGEPAEKPAAADAKPSADPEEDMMN